MNEKIYNILSANNIQLINWLYFTLIILFFVLLFVKIRKYFRLYEENSTFDIINNLYAQFNQLANVQVDWCLSHLLCLNKTEYEKACSNIKEVIKNFPEEKLIELRFKEKHMVINILVFYEQIYYQFNHSQMFKRRKKFLYNLNDYFLNRLLFQNPRLVYYILSNPMGIGLHLEEESYRDILIKYEERIMKAAIRDAAKFSNDQLFYDDKGPFLKSEDINIQLVSDTNQLNSFM